MNMCARCRPMKLTGAFETDNGETRIVCMVELDQILDHWFVDVRAR